MACIMRDVFETGVFIYGIMKEAALLVILLRLDQFRHQQIRTVDVGKERNTIDLQGTILATYSSA